MIRQKIFEQFTVLEDNNMVRLTTGISHTRKSLLQSNFNEENEREGSFG